MADLDQLARRIADGDEAAFTALVAATTPRLHRLALRMTGDGDDAADVLQEALVRAHRALSRTRWSGPARVETWLYRIVVNTSLNWRRSWLRRRSAPAPVDEAAAPAQEQQLLARRAAALLASLTAEQRAVIVLKEIEGFTAAEVAALLGCSESAVEQRLLRARAQLRKRWDHE